MLQQTRVEAVREAYVRFLNALPDIESLAHVPDDELMKLWEGLGYYRRARGLKAAAQKIMTDFGGTFPGTEEELLELPGVGRYTAGAVGSIAFGLAIPAVDGNVMRVISRMQESDENVLNDRRVKEVTDMLRALMQKHFHENEKKGQGNPCGDFNQALFELGACICTPKDPKCSECPVRESCGAFAHGTVDRYPVRIQKTKRKAEKRTVLVIRDGDLCVLRKRPDTGLLAGLFEFPNYPGSLAEDDIIVRVREMGLEPIRIRSLGDAKHLFSHVEWDMTGYEVTVASPGGPYAEGVILASHKDLALTYAMPSAFHAYLRAFMEET